MAMPMPIAYQMKVVILPREWYAPCRKPRKLSQRFWLTIDNKILFELICSICKGSDELKLLQIDGEQTAIQCLKRRIIFHAIKSNPTTIGTTKLPCIISLLLTFHFSFASISANCNMINRRIICNNKIWTVHTSAQRSAASTEGEKRERKKREQNRNDKWWICRRL